MVTVPRLTHRFCDVILTFLYTASYPKNDKETIYLPGFKFRILNFPIESLVAKDTNALSLAAKSLTDTCSKGISSSVSFTIPQSPPFLFEV